MWQIKKDVKSLFQEQKYASIDGMRSISCLMIISIHIGSILNSFIPPYPDQQWAIYLKSYSFRLSTLLTLALETFFMLSGFLLTSKFIEQPWSFSLKGYPMYIIKRACRFWPGILLITIVMLLLGEPEGNWTSLWLFYQNYVSMEQWSPGFASLWSISLDMQMHIILPIILHIATYSKWKNARTYSILYILVFLSIIHLLIVYDSETMNLSTIICRCNSLALMMSQRICDWIRTEYNVTMAFEKPIHPNPLVAFMYTMYLPILSRYGSFIIGSILAFYTNDNNKNKDQHPIRHGKIRKYSYFTLIFLFMLLLAVPGDPEKVSQIVIRIMFSILRQLFTISQAFILFSTICPSTHPYYSPWLKSFLSLRIWTPIAKLSYLVYILHFRIAFELIMTHWTILNPQRIPMDYLVLICLGLVLAISLVLSAVWFILVEKPFERFINVYLSRDKKVHTQ